MNKALFYKFTLLILVFCVVGEVALRIIHDNNKPFVPSVTKDLIPTLPHNSDFYSEFNGHKSTRYVTGLLGQRVASTELREVKCELCIFVLGDNQALGWGIDYQNTLGAILANSLLGDGGKSRILASPRLDPELAHFLVQSYRKKFHDEQLISIFILNLANDLDEMFIGRQAMFDINVNWLSMNSFLYMYLVMGQDTIFNRVSSIPMGATPIFSALNADEHENFIYNAVSSITKTVLSMPQAKNNIIVITPSSEQLLYSIYKKLNINLNSKADYLKGRNNNSDILTANRQSIGNIKRSAEIMEKVEKLIEQQLRPKGFQVIRLSKHLHEREDLVKYINASNSHLTERGNALIANIIQQLLRSHNP